MKKTISLILALVMTVSVLFGLNVAAYADDIPTHIGSNITVSYNSGTKTLTLSGSGRIEDQTTSPFIAINELISSIVIGEGITAVGDSLFEGSMAILKNATLSLPSTLTEIGDNAFSGTRIAVFNIPASVTVIGDFAFAPSYDANSKSVFTQEIYVESGNQFFSSVDGVLYNKDMTKLIQAPAALSGSDGVFTVPDTVVNIGASAFLRCLNLTKVTIPESVELIGDNAFSLCKNLTEIVFENHRQNLSIAVSAFKYSYYDGVSQTVTVLNNDNMLFKAYQNTSALIYAKNNGISYEVLDPDVPVLTGWQKLDGKWYYYNDDGSLRTGWLKYGGKWYLLAYADGHMLTGWARAGGKWYYMNSSGAMLTGWQKVGGYWYYLNSSGAMQTGWIKLSGKWYYLNSNGTMRTANLTYKGKVYRFNKSGVCLNP